MSGDGLAMLRRLDALGAEVRLDRERGLLWRPAHEIGPEAEAEARALVRRERAAVKAALLAPCPFQIACGPLGPCERRLRGRPCMIETSGGNTGKEQAG